MGVIWLSRSIVENGYEGAENQATISTQQLNTFKENRNKKALYFIYQVVDESILRGSLRHQHQRR
ncbi:hypothetical protein OROHE_001302 [Orobanche hederae]